MLLPFIGFGAPILILLVFHLLFWRGTGRFWLRLFFIYASSVATGILADVVWQVGPEPSAVIAGVGAPLFYSILFTLLLAAKRAGTPRTQENGPSPRAPEARGWSPTVVAAVIQAIATLLAAVIASR